MPPPSSNCFCPRTPPEPARRGNRVSLISAPLPARSGLGSRAGRIEAGPAGPHVDEVPRPSLAKRPRPVRRDGHDVCDFPVGFSGCAQFEGAPDRFVRQGLFASGPASALPGAVGGLFAVRPEHGPALDARPRRGRIVPPPLNDFPLALRLPGHLLNSLGGDAHRLADRLQGLALFQQRFGPGPPGRQAFRPNRPHHRPRHRPPAARRAFAPFKPAALHAASLSSSARTASPMAEQETGCWPGPAMSAVRTPAASTFSTAPSTRSASSPMSKL